MIIESTVSNGVFINFHTPAPRSAAGYSLQTVDGKVHSPLELIEPDKKCSHLRNLVMCEGSDLTWPIPFDKYKLQRQLIRVHLVNEDCITTHINGSRLDIYNYYLQNEQRAPFTHIEFDLTQRARYAY